MAHYDNKGRFWDDDAVVEYYNTSTIDELLGDIYIKNTKIWQFLSLKMQPKAYANNELPSEYNTYATHNHENQQINMKTFLKEKKLNERRVLEHIRFGWILIHPKKKDLTFGKIITKRTYDKSTKTNKWYFYQVKGFPYNEKPKLIAILSSNNSYLLRYLNNNTKYKEIKQIRKISGIYAGRNFTKEIKKNN